MSNPTWQIALIVSTQVDKFFALGFKNDPEFKKAQSLPVEAPRDQPAPKKKTKEPKAKVTPKQGPKAASKKASAKKNVK